MPRTVFGKLRTISGKTHLSRGQSYKTFLSIVYEFLYKARLFVRLGWKSLQRQTLWLITKICKLRTKQFITFVQARSKTVEHLMGFTLVISLLP